MVDGVRCGCRGSQFGLCHWRRPWLRRWHGVVLSLIEDGGELQQWHGVPLSLFDQVVGCGRCAFGKGPM